MSYIQYVYTIFNFFEDGLYSVAAYLGTTYEELNIFIFIGLVIHTVISYSCIGLLFGLWLNCLREVKQLKALRSP